MILEKLFAKKEVKMQTKRNRAGRKLNESEWKRIKTMLDAGFTCTQVANNRNVAWKIGTIEKVKRSASFADYQKKSLTGSHAKKAEQGEFDFDIPQSETFESFLDMNEGKVMFCFDFKSKDFDAVMGHLHALDSLATHKMDRIIFNGGRITRVLQEQADE